MVTGGAGFIGSHLVDALMERGDEVLCIDDLSFGSRANHTQWMGHPRFDFERCDVLDCAFLLDGVDVIFHLAASKNVVCREDPERDLMINAMGTLRLLRLAKEVGARFVHASTGSVCGEGLQTEDSPRAPRTFYGISKTAGESYAQLFNLGPILRYYHVIGPRQSETGVVPTFVYNALRGKPLVIHGTGEQVRSFTSVYDVVKANLELVDKQGVYNVASGLQVTIKELAEFIADELGGSIVYGPARPGDRLTCNVDNSKIGMEFDQDWQSVVREVIEWERA